MHSDSQAKTMRAQARARGRPAAPRRPSRPPPPRLGGAVAGAGRRPRSGRADPRQGADRPAPAAAPPRLAAHGGPAGRHAGHRLDRLRPALPAAGAPVRPGDAFGAAPARMGLRPRAAAADGVLRPGHHRPAGQPRHQRHRGGQDAVHPGAVRDPRQQHRPGRHDGGDGLAGLAPDADRARAGAGGGADRLAVPAHVGAGGDPRARAAQRHQRPDGRVDRRHERAAGEQRRRPASPSASPTPTTRTTRRAWPNCAPTPSCCAPRSTCSTWSCWRW